MHQMTPFPFPMALILSVVPAGLKVTLKALASPRYFPSTPVQVRLGKGISLIHPSFLQQFHECLPEHVIPRSHLLAAKGTKRSIGWELSLSWRQLTLQDFVSRTTDRQVLSFMLITFSYSEIKHAISHLNKNGRLGKFYLLCDFFHQFIYSVDSQQAGSMWH